jgi:hypothetical protein
MRLVYKRLRDEDRSFTSACAFSYALVGETNYTDVNIKRTCLTKEEKAASLTAVPGWPTLADLVDAQPPPTGRIPLSGKRWKELCDRMRAMSNVTDKDMAYWETFPHAGREERVATPHRSGNKCRQTPADRQRMTATGMSVASVDAPASPTLLQRSRYEREAQQLAQSGAKRTRRRVP